MGHPPYCPMVVPHKIIKTIGAYFDILNGVLREGQTFWFRGHAERGWDLTPSALRYKNASARRKALDLLADFQRFTEIKLAEGLPAPNDRLRWVQTARHYGLDTRLLDWTKNAAMALYFACSTSLEEDGAVFILNPVNLNKEVAPKKPRVFDAHQDGNLIAKYLRLKGRENRRGRKTIAIAPVWNSERITIQQGAFTLHGSRSFTLTAEQAPGLAHVKIRSEYKERLLVELDRVGVNEMTIFPEPEHVCNYLKWREDLVQEGT